MRVRFQSIAIPLTVLAGFAFLAAGCNKEDNKAPQAKNPNNPTEKKDGTDKKKEGTDKPVAKEGDKKGHDGWWCQEHGVPEHLCSLCLADEDVKTMFKDKNDWCKKHDRAQSQCFKCDPKLYAKYEKMHEDKYGTKPKRPPESEFKD